MCNIEPDKIEFRGAKGKASEIYHGDPPSYAHDYIAKMKIVVEEHYVLWANRNGVFCD